LHFSLNKKHSIATASSYKVNTKNNKVMCGFRNVDINTRQHNLLSFVIYNILQCRQDYFVSIQQSLFICGLYKGSQTVLLLAGWELKSRPHHHSLCLPINIISGRQNLIHLMPFIF